MIYCPNLEGLKYFIWLCTIDKGIPNLPLDIRTLIYDKYEKQMYVECLIKDAVKLRLNIKRYF